MNTGTLRRAVRGLVIATLALLPIGCETGGQTGAVVGGGMGALMGQAIGQDTEATLIGAAVGTGVGYIIGNEQDKRRAREMQSSQPTSPPTHSQVGSLGGTRWTIVSLNPSDHVPPYVSRVLEFKRNGRLITTTTSSDGSVDVADESYRVVGDTLIVNKPGYLVNARYSISGDQLVISAEDFSAVLQRL